MRKLLPEIAQDWLTGSRSASLAVSTQQLSEAYRQGRSSSDPRVGLNAYIASRLPATYAAVSRVLAEVEMLRPQWAPASLIDLGAGPGTASWAAAETWTTISRFDLFEINAEFRRLAAVLASQSSMPALRQANVVEADITSGPVVGMADLVIAAYAFIELNELGLMRAVERAWQATTSTLVLIEPGTPVAFERLRTVRRHLLSLGASILAPCPGNGECPIAAPDWCHFSQRLGRSRLHKHAKSAVVPYEDEKFSYIVAVRDAAKPAAARIIKPVRRLKHGVQLHLCRPEGLDDTVIAKRDKPAYRIASKLAWGDALPATKGSDDGT